MIGQLPAWLFNGDFFTAIKSEYVYSDSRFCLTTLYALSMIVYSLYELTLLTKTYRFGLSYQRLLFRAIMSLM